MDAAKHVHGLHGNRSLSVLIASPCSLQRVSDSIPQDFPNCVRKFTVNSMKDLERRNSQEE